MKTLVLLLVGAVLTVVGLVSSMRTADRLGKGRYSDKREHLWVKTWWLSLATYVFGATCMVLALVSYSLQLIRYIARGDSDV